MNVANVQYVTVGKLSPCSVTAVATSKWNFFDVTGIVLKWKKITNKFSLWYPLCKLHINFYMISWGNGKKVQYVVLWLSKSFLLKHSNQTVHVSVVALKWCISIRWTSYFWCISTLFSHSCCCFLIFSHKTCQKISLW